mmetsp:Transcript_10238/g.21681  ORF Transcript_10238/g.21681 Transcript_10238/m.21681 type:complete len:329 (+) Transcript_10238:130-1116(+)
MRQALLGAVLLQLVLLPLAGAGTSVLRALRGPKLLNPTEEAKDGDLRAFGVALGVADFPACCCSQCVGKRVLSDMNPSGNRGFQCYPVASEAKQGQGICKQQGNEEQWVVQTAALVAYERFCVMTCKPLLRKAIDQEVACTHLSQEEVVLRAQTPYGNGRTFVFRTNPLTDSPSLAKISAAWGSVEDDESSEDPANLMRNAFAAVGKRPDPTVRATEASSTGVEEVEVLPRSCNCHCGDEDGESEAAAEQVPLEQPPLPPLQPEPPPPPPPPLPPPPHAPEPYSLPLPPLPREVFLQATRFIAKQRATERHCPPCPCSGNAGKVMRRS